MNSLPLNVECTPTDSKGSKKGGALKKTVLLDPNLKISDATRVLLDKFGLTHEKDASSYAICIRKDTDGKTKYLIPNATQTVSASLGSLSSKETVVLRRRNKAGTSSKSEGGLFKTLLSAVYLEKIDGGKVCYVYFRRLSHS
jgi:hypothetical protein